MAKMKDWLSAAVATLSDKSDLAAAIRDADLRLSVLSCNCFDGNLEIGNNAAERALRTVALGRESGLFCGSDAGGERAAAICSLIGTAKLNRNNPEA